MIKIIIIIILLLLNYLFNYNELFYSINNEMNISYPSNKHTTSIYENRFKFIPVTINKNILFNYNDLKSDKCCLVKKELDNNNNYKYIYTKYNDNECNIDNFTLDQNNQLLFDGINNWNNNECKDESKILGSCQHYNFECIDFVDEKTCNNYNEKMPDDPLNRKIHFTWYNKPCYNR